MDMSLVKDTSDLLREASDHITNMSKLYFQMGMEDLQMLMRAYEMMFIGRCDMSQSELQKEMIKFIFGRIGPDKFRKWGNDAGLSCRDWDYLWKIGEIDA